MIRFVCSVSLLATLSLASEKVVCPSQNILQSVGCSCEPLSRALEVECDATQWNPETSAKLLESLNDSRISSFTFRGELIWEDKRSSTNSSLTSGTERFSPFYALCKSRVSHLEFIDFTFQGMAPECSFNMSQFLNVTMDFPLFFSGFRSAMVFLGNQTHLAGLEHLRSVEYLAFLKCGTLDLRRIRNLTKLVSLGIYHTPLQSPELKSELLPQGIFNLRGSICWKCNITSVNSIFLDNMPRLEFLDLSRNRITDLPEALFKNRRLNLSIAENPLDCDKLDWLVKLIHAKSIELIDGWKTYCAYPCSYRFLEKKESKSNCAEENVTGTLGRVRTADSSAEDSTCSLSWADISACAIIFACLGFLLAMLRAGPPKNRALEKQSSRLTAQKKSQFLAAGKPQLSNRVFPKSQKPNIFVPSHETAYFEVAIR